MYEGVELPVAYYGGGIRDRDPAEPELVDHEVMWGGMPATAASVVWSELRKFEHAAQSAVDALDAVVEPGVRPGDPSTLESVLALAAALNNEWVRIHPHVNGNGRIARCWANWVLIRYGLPPVVWLRPPPDAGRYERAAALARQRLHGPMRRCFLHLLRRELESETRRHGPSGRYARADYPRSSTPPRPRHTSPRPRHTHLHQRCEGVPAASSWRSRCPYSAR
jgi:Fic/DOC family